MSANDSTGIDGLALHVRNDERSCVQEIVVRGDGMKAAGRPSWCRKVRGRCMKSCHVSGGGRMSFEEY